MPFLLLIPSFSSIIFIFIEIIDYDNIRYVIIHLVERVNIAVALATHK